MIDQYVIEIQKGYPELAIENAYLNEDGQYNDVVVVNDALIFRFAKFPESVKTLQRETTILLSIQNYISLDIPNPIYQNLEGRTPDQTFVGYPMISGTPLWHEYYQEIRDESVLDTMADQLATFLKELHSIPVQGVVPIKLVNEDKRPYWMDLYTRFRANLFPHLSLDGCDRVIAHFENFLDHPDQFDYEPVLRHGDFGGGNIIFDDEANRIGGIIDFGFAGLGDPAIDVGGLFSFGESFVKRCYRIYPEIEEMLPRVHFYRGTFALQEALYGIEHDDPEAFEAGIADYQ
ncbi:phosphotransferase [Chloroflexi bacterium TSY]|nr:phosphotransferase [Chloroflexi bacterium TSY]